MPVHGKGDIMEGKDKEDKTMAIISISRQVAALGDEIATALAKKTG